MYLIISLNYLSIDHSKKNNMVQCSLNVHQWPVFIIVSFYMTHKDIHMYLKLIRAVWISTSVFILICGFANIELRCVISANGKSGKHTKSAMKICCWTDKIVPTCFHAETNFLL